MEKHKGPVRPTGDPDQDIVTSRVEYKKDEVGKAKHSSAIRDVGRNLQPSRLVSRVWSSALVTNGAENDIDHPEIRNE